MQKIVAAALLVKLSLVASVVALAFVQPASASVQTFNAYDVASVQRCYEDMSCDDDASDVPSDAWGAKIDALR